MINKMINVKISINSESLMDSEVVTVSTWRFHMDTPIYTKIELYYVTIVLILIYQVTSHEFGLHVAL
jgi:hypothetical protein